MKKKRPQQQVTPPTKGLNIIALKRSASPVEPSQEQPTAVSIEKPEIDAASAHEPVAQNPVDEPYHAASSVQIEYPRLYLYLYLSRLSHLLIDGYSNPESDY